MRPCVAIPFPIPNLQILLPSHPRREERSPRRRDGDTWQAERRNRFGFRFNIPCLGLRRERGQENVSGRGSSLRQHRVEREHAANAGSGGIEVEDFGRSGGGSVGSAAVAVVDAVEPADEGDVGGAVGVVLDPLDDAERRGGVTFEIDGSLQALGAAAAVEGGYAAGGVAAGGLAGSEGELP